MKFYKTLVVLLSQILFPNGTLFIIKHYMIEKRTEIRML